MVTEEVARTRWCPFTRVGEQQSGAAENRPDGSYNCIASECMAWRKHFQIGIGPNGEKRDRDMDGRTRWVDVGTCGLAGHADPSFVVHRAKP
jgi:hypothetical protein